jgi:hypothetical protein
VVNSSPGTRRTADGEALHKAFPSTVTANSSKTRRTRPQSVFHIFAWLWTDSQTTRRAHNSLLVRQTRRLKRRGRIDIEIQEPQNPYVGFVSSLFLQSRASTRPMDIQSITNISSHTVCLAVSNWIGYASHIVFTRFDHRTLPPSLRTYSYCGSPL